LENFQPLSKERLLLDSARLSRGVTQRSDYPPHSHTTQEKVFQAENFFR